MKSRLSRPIGAFALLACFLAPLSARSVEPTEQLPEPRPGLAERVAKMEAELKAMREEAANDPSRPSMAELRRELDEMAAERDAKDSRQSKADRLAWWLTGSFGLNLVLAPALLWALLRRGGATTKTAQA